MGSKGGERRGGPWLARQQELTASFKLRNRSMVRTDNVRIKIGEEKNEVRNNHRRRYGSRRAANVGLIRNNRRLRELRGCGGGQTERARNRRSQLFLSRPNDS